MNTWRSESVHLIKFMYINTKQDEARLLLNYKGLEYKTEWVSQSRQLM
jgi:hypothetical protein